MDTFACSLNFASNVQLPRAAGYVQSQEPLSSPCAASGPTVLPRYEDQSASLPGHFAALVSAGAVGGGITSAAARRSRRRQRKQKGNPCTQLSALERRQSAAASDAAGFSRRDAALASAVVSVVNPGAAVAEASAAKLAKLVVPPVLIGCWQLLERSRSKEQALATLERYADAGFLAYDTADIYGPSEGIIGEFRRKYDQKKGAGAADKDITIFTKYVTRDVSDDQIQQVNDRSRKALGVSSLDVVQYCWFAAFKNLDHVTAGKKLQELQTAGKIKHLAGCNYDTKHLKELVDAGVPIEANQVQFSLLDLRVENGMLEYCKEKGIQLACFGTVGGGWLSDKYLGVPDPGGSPEGATVSKRMYRSSLSSWADWSTFQELLKTLRKVADGRGCSIANVAVAWVQQRLQETCGGGVIIGVRDDSHIEDLQRQSSVKLTTEDMQAIRAILDKGKKPRGDVWSRERAPN